MKITLLTIWGGKHGDKSIMCVQPKALYKYLDAHSLPREIANQCLEALRPFLSEKQTNTPYERENGMYYINLGTFVANYKTILDILNNYLSNV